MALTCLAVLGTPAHAQDAEPVRFERDGLKLELAALSHDQVRAFFLARGFSQKDTEHIAVTACLFRSAIGSAFAEAGAPAVKVALDEWQAMPADGKPSAPKVREYWENVWKTREVPADAATAFYWALFPTEQVFAPTDYNWGFLTFGLPPGTSFNLMVAWTTDDKAYHTTIEGLQCAK